MANVEKFIRENGGCVAGIKVDGIFYDVISFDEVAGFTCVEDGNLYCFGIEELSNMTDVKFYKFTEMVIE